MPVCKVVDSWALLAWIRNEGPTAHVQHILQQADEGEVSLLMSWISVGEVYYMLARKHGERVADEFLLRLPSLPIGLVEPDEHAIIAAAKLKSTPRNYGKEDQS